MHQIEEVECFSNCTKLCKPHESNKAIWEIWENLNGADDEEKKLYVKSLLDEQKEILPNIEHAEFI